MTVTYTTAVDQWSSPSERINKAYQGVGKPNMLKHRVSANDASADDEYQAVAKNVYANRFALL